MRLGRRTPPQSTLRLRDAVMSVTMPLTVPSDSFYHIQNHQSELNEIPADQREVLFPFLLNAKYMNSRLSPQTRQLRGTEIKVRNFSLCWLTGTPDPILWEQLVPGQKLGELTDHRRELVVRALEHLADRHPDAFDVVRNFVRLICWVDLVPDLKGDEPIGGGTSPLLPLTVFMSNSAMRGLAPNTAAAHRSPRILAENFLHEATHNRLGIYIAEEDVFVESYDAETSPMLDIVWHYEPDGSHPKWALDRALHAACVYNELFEYRMRELADEGCESYERDAFIEASAVGARAVDHLTQHLLCHQDQFTGTGVEFITEVRRRTVNVLARWAQMEVPGRY